MVLALSILSSNLWKCWSCVQAWAAIRSVCRLLSASYAGVSAYRGTSPSALDKSICQQRERQSPQDAEVLTTARKLCTIKSRQRACRWPSPASSANASRLPASLTAPAMAIVASFPTTCQGMPAHSQDRVLLSRWRRTFAVGAQLGGEGQLAQLHEVGRAVVGGDGQAAGGGLRVVAAVQLVGEAVPKEGSHGILHTRMAELFSGLANNGSPVRLLQGDWCGRISPCGALD